MPVEFQGEISEDDRAVCQLQSDMAEAMWAVIPNGARISDAMAAAALMIVALAKESNMDRGQLVFHIMGLIMAAPSVTVEPMETNEPQTEEKPVESSQDQP